MNGSVIHLTTVSRPDIAYAVVKLSQYANNPNSTHMAAMKHLYRYLVGIQYLSIVYSNSEQELHGYSDSSYASDSDDCKPFCGYVFFLHAGPISWRSYKQANVALSTVEAEYTALSDSICELLHLRQKIAEIEQTPM